MTECASRKAAKAVSAITVADSSRDLAHDIRTPLNIIIGFSELLLEEIPGKLNDEQRLDVNDILASGRRLLRLVNNMLERYGAEASRGR